MYNIYIHFYSTEGDGNMKKSRIFILLAICSVMLIASGCDLIKVVDTSYIAKVNGEEISVNEYKFYLETAKATILQAANQQQPSADFWTTTEIEGKKAGDIAKERALDDAVRATLIAQQAKKESLSAETNEAKQQIAKQKAQIQNFVTQFGLDDEAVNIAYQKAYLRAKLCDKYEKDGKISTGAEDIKKFYEEQYVTVKHILFITTDPSTQEQKRTEEDAKQVADETLAKIKEGADFDALVNELSEDPGSKSSPNAYTFRQDGSMDKAFEDASFKLQVNEVSEPIKSSFGYHIIKRYPLISYEDFLAENTGMQQSSPEDTIRAALASDTEDKFVEEWKGSATIEKNDEKYDEIKVS